MKKFEVVFFGTQNFAIKILQGLIKSPDFNVGLVITQPDQLVGRKKELTASPVKILAEKNNLKIEQPESLKNSTLDLSNFDVAVVAQYGKIIPLRLLNMPKKGMINVHASLLPKYRGASPIQFAILNGEQKTGVTIMKMDEKMDTGPIFSQAEILIAPNDIYSSLEEKLANIATPLLIKSLTSYLEDQIVPLPQNETEATYTKILQREDGLIDFNKKAEEIYNQWRAYLPWPGIFLETELNGQKNKVKILKITPLDIFSEQKPGSFVRLSKKTLGIVGGDKKILEILEIQAENKKVMSSEEFINGYKIT